jgi:hypothetical protein
MPYSVKVIAEIASLPAYESQVSDLMTGDERMAMGFILPAGLTIIR